MLRNVLEIRSVKSILSGIVVSAVVGVHPSFAANLTAGSLMKDMPAGERALYISGVIDGLAFARFRKDTVAKGEKDETGMACILNWFNKDSLATVLRIERTFEKYADEYPPMILALMVKKECGE